MPWLVLEGRMTREAALPDLCRSTRIVYDAFCARAIDLSASRNPGHTEPSHAAMSLSLGWTEGRMAYVGRAVRDSRCP